MLKVLTGDMERIKNSRIKDAELYERTLIEMMAGDLAWGIVIAIAVMFLKDRIYNLIGTGVGVFLSLFLTWHMWQTLPKSIDRGEAGARKFTILGGLLRYGILLGVFGGLCYLNFGNPLLAFAGVMGTKISAYLQPLIHRLFMKLFSWKEPEYPEYIPEEEEEPEEDRTII